MKAPGIHSYVAGSIPAVTPRYCTKKIEKCSLEHQKKQRKKNILTVLSGCAVPTAISCCSFPAVLSGLFCPVCPFPVVLYQNYCPSTFVSYVPSLLPCFEYLSYVFCSRYPVPVVLFAVLSWQSIVN
jgi:hypothetical protein